MGDNINPWHDVNVFARMESSTIDRMSICLEKRGDLLKIADAVRC